MTVHFLRLSLVSAALLITHSVFADPPRELADDPLPKGAKVRFGVTRPILRLDPAVALVPPGCTNLLAPTLTGGIRRYDLGTGRPLDKKGIVGTGQVVVSADGKRAAVARAGTLTVVDVATGARVLAVEPPVGVILAGTPGASLSGDGKVLAYGGRGNDGKGMVVVWNVDRNEALAQLETAQAAPVFPVLSQDGKTVITHGPPPPRLNLGAANPPPPMPPDENPDMARAAQVWTVADGQELFKARVTGMGGRVVAAAFSPDGQMVAVSAGDGPVDLWEVKTGKRLHTLLGRHGQGVKVAISPDGKTIASVGPDYSIQRWTAEGKPLGTTEPPGGVLIVPVTGLTFADNERVIAWITAAQFAVAWEAPSAKVLSPDMSHAAAIRSISFPPGEKNPFTSGQDGRVFRWDMDTGVLNESITLHPARLPGQPLVLPVVTLSADATRAFWPRLPITEIFDLDTCQGIFVVPPPSSPQAPVYVNASPDGMKLITVSRQTEGRRTGSCVIWDLATQQRVAEFDVPPSSGASAPGAVLSPDGTRLVVATTRIVADKPVLAVIGYDLKAGKKLAEVEDANVTGTVTLAVADDIWVVVTSTSGRVWAVDYANGKIGEDIETVAARGEIPLTGPVLFSPDGQRFATGVVGEPFTTYGVRVYDWPQRKVLHTFIGHAGPVSALRFTPDGKTLASGAQDTSVLLWDLTKTPEGN